MYVFSYTPAGDLVLHDESTASMVAARMPDRIFFFATIEED